MRYDTCRRCPKNKVCEREFKKQEKKKQHNKKGNKQN